MGAAAAVVGVGIAAQIAGTKFELDAQDAEQRARKDQITMQNALRAQQSNEIAARAEINMAGIDRQAAKMAGNATTAAASSGFSDIPTAQLEDIAIDATREKYNVQREAAFSRFILGQESEQATNQIGFMEEAFKARKLGTILTGAGKAVSGAASMSGGASSPQSFSGASK